MQPSIRWKGCADGADMRELMKLLAQGDESAKFEDLTATAREHGLFERRRR
jgi:hypothetical protein